MSLPLSDGQERWRYMWNTYGIDADRNPSDALAAAMAEIRRAHAERDALRKELEYWKRVAALTRDNAAGETHD